MRKLEANKPEIQTQTGTVHLNIFNLLSGLTIWIALVKRKNPQLRVPSTKISRLIDILNKAPFKAT